MIPQVDRRVCSRALSYGHTAPVQASNATTATSECYRVPQWCEVAYLKVKHPESLTLEGGTVRLYRNVGN